MSLTVTVFETQDPHAPPHRRFAALIDYNGFKGASPHLCSWTRAATYEEAKRKADDFVTATLNPEKKHKTPSDSATIAAVEDAAEDFPV